MKRNEDRDKEKSETQDKGNEPKPPPFNTSLDPDNVTSPLDFEERMEEGREHFFPEGGPEDPPTESFDSEYGKT